MSPEQACNSGQTDIRSDIYSLGCTFYCLLTGRPPFAAASLLEVMVQHLQAPVPPVTQLRPDVPAAVAAVVERMLAKRPDERYQTPGAVAEALRPLATPAGSGEAAAPGRPIHLYPATPPGGVPDLPTQTVPRAATPASAPTSVMLPQPGRVERAVTATARVVFGCLALFLLLIASTIVGIVLMTRTGGHQGEETSAEGPRAGKLSGLDLVRFSAGRMEPSFGPTGSSVEVPRDFEMSIKEVTMGQFAAFVKGESYVTSAENDATRPGAWVLAADGTSDWSGAATWNTWRGGLTDETPVVCVSWEDAVRFCNWLSKHEGVPQCYLPRGGPGGGWECDFRATGYRLPTEAEWELAARAGAPTLYPATTTELLTHGWFRENSGGRPQPVGHRDRNPRGLCDVWGNVWEWCWDRQDMAAPKLPLSPTGPESGDDRVVRGCGWADPAPQSPARTRKAWPPERRANDLGFRVARTR
jgi:formylglycine-generating enzyme required for sulfatase activity